VKRTRVRRVREGGVEGQEEGCNGSQERREGSRQGCAGEAQRQGSQRDQEEAGRFPEAS